MSQNLNTAIAVVGIDIGKNSFHVVGQDERGTIGLHQKWSRGQVETRFANRSRLAWSLPSPGPHPSDRSRAGLQRADHRGHRLRICTAADPHRHAVDLDLDGAGGSTRLPRPIAASTTNRALR